RTGSRVSVAVDVAHEHGSTNRGIGVATEISTEGIYTDSSVELAGREIKKSAMPLRRIAVRITSIGLWAHRFYCGQERKAAEQERNAKQKRPSKRTLNVIRG